MKTFLTSALLLIAMLCTSTAQINPILRNPWSTNTAGTPVIGQNNLSVTNTADKNWQFFGTNAATVARLIDITNIVLISGTNAFILKSGGSGTNTLLITPILSAPVTTNIQAWWDPTDALGLSMSAKSNLNVGGTVFITNKLGVGTYTLGGYAMAVNGETWAVGSTLYGGIPILTLTDTGGDDYQVMVDTNLYMVRNDTDSRVDFVIDGVGRVGIQTNIPQQRLHVNGSSLFESNVTVIGTGTISGALIYNYQLGSTSVYNVSLAANVASSANTILADAPYIDLIDTISPKSYRILVDTNTLTIGDQFTGVVDLLIDRYGRLGITTNAYIGGPLYVTNGSYLSVPDSGAALTVNTNWMIVSNAFVGIGTNPSLTLHVASPATNNEMAFQVNTAEGIGLKLDGDGDLTTLGSIYTYSASGTYAAMGSGTLAVYGNTPQLQFIDATSGDDDWIIFANGDTLYFTNIISGSSGPLIDALGKVGIGTNTPAQLLNVAAITSDSTPAIQINNDARGYGMRVNGSLQDQFEIYDTAFNNSVFRIATDQTNNMLVITNNKVGIGTTAVNQLLTVASSIGGQMLELTYSIPYVWLLDTGGDDYQMIADTNYFMVRNSTDSRVDIAIDGDGNVGIGTNIPATKLNVASIVSDSTPAIQINNDVQGYGMRVNGSLQDQFEIYDANTANSVVRIATAQSANMIVVTNNQVGIGAVPVAGYTLYVNGGLYQTLSYVVSANPMILFTDSSGTDGYRIWVDTNWFKIFNASDVAARPYDLGITGEGETIINGTNGTVLFFASVTNNRVGIGTLIPSYALGVAGSIGSSTYIESPSLVASAAAPQINLDDSTASPGDDWRICADGSLLYFTNKTDSRCDFVIDGSGNIGIGTNIPATKLNVATITSDSTPAIQINNDVQGWAFRVNGSTTSDELDIVDNTSGNSVFRISTNQIANMIVVTNNRVGISGRPAPLYTVEVAGTIGEYSTNPFFNFDDSSGEDDYQININTNYFVIRNTSDSRNDIAIDGSGNTTIPSLFVTAPTNGVAPPTQVLQPIGLFGSMMMGITNTVTVGSSGTYYTLTNFNSVTTNGFSCNAATGFLTNSTAGFYRISGGVTALPGNSDMLELEVFFNETGKEEISSFGQYDTVARVRTLPLTGGVLYIPAGTGISLRVNNRSAAVNVSVWRASLTVGTP